MVERRPACSRPRSFSRSGCVNSKRIVADLDFLETVAIVALKKAQEEVDHRLNSFLERVCREIAYPGTIPVVQHCRKIIFTFSGTTDSLCSINRGHSSYTCPTFITS